MTEELQNKKKMIKTPTLLLDKTRCKNNIAAMAEKAKKHRLIFRPHFKTHQSAVVGQWFKAAGANKITVSSLKMADYFAGHGWDDITVAFPVNILEMDLINQLAKSIRLNLLVESPEMIDLLAQRLHSPVCVFIKIDIGNHRAGLAPDDSGSIDKVLEKMDAASNISFAGFLGHAGHSYACRNIKQIQQVHEESTGFLIHLKERYRSQYPEIIASAGDTPTCSLMDNFDGIDEIRPGNFVFYDLTQKLIGACSSAQIAVAMACPVVAVHKNRNEILLYGGGIHFSKDSLHDEKLGTIYGKPVESKGAGWGNVVEGAYVKSLSQEHGIVHIPDSLINQYKEGDLIKILPVHSCMTADIMKEYLTLEGEKISML